MDHPSPNDPALPTQAGTTNTWADLGFTFEDTDEGTVSTLPNGHCVLRALQPEAQQALAATAIKVITSQPFGFSIGGCTHYLLKLAPDVKLEENPKTPEGVGILLPGSRVQLPPEAPQFELPELTKEGVAILALDPILMSTPLNRFSLRGQGADFIRNAVKAKPLLGEVCFSGQANIWYAPPGSGKTLISLKLLADAVAEKRITPENVYYVNGDDSSEGFAEKLGLMDDMGCHTLAPGHRGFSAPMLPDLFNEMKDPAKAKGALIILDTIKKFTNLMDKGKASSFSVACRTAIMAGATILGFAHTNKNPMANGKLVYGGTSDLRDDFDAVYIAGPLDLEGFEGERLVQFECLKSSGANIPQAIYAYADGRDLSYAERLASVRLVDERELQGFRRIEETKADAEIIAAVEACIRDADYGKMALAKVAAAKADVSERAALRVIQKYTGTDPACARWHFKRKAHGAMIYTLLPRADHQPPSDPPAP